MSPAVLLCHGWGGLRPHLFPLAERFARAGFVALVFDYRGWGDSDGRLASLDETPPLTKAGPATVRARVLREVVDPVDQTTDARNCLAFLRGEKGIDPGRVGLWGTSFGAGHVITLAGEDERVGAVVAQVGGYGLADAFREHGRRRLTERARGDIDPPVPQGGLDGLPGLAGSADVARMLDHHPLRAAERVRAPVLIIDAAHDELNDPAANGRAVHAIVGRHAVCDYRALPCGHFAVYEQYAEEATALAIGWFERHLAKRVDAEAEK